MKGAGIIAVCKLKWQFKFQEFELVVKDGQCCGECVQTKCRADERVYTIGDMWKSKDGCTFSECVKRGDAVSVTSYKKTCPELNNCPEENVSIKDCCPYCQIGKQAANDGNEAVIAC